MSLTEKHIKSLKAHYLQWDFRASQNSVTLRVEAPKTDVTVTEPTSPDDDVTVTETPEDITVVVPPQKTPEQIQAEAEQSGSLRVRHEFSWWFPWYRIHFVSVCEGLDQFDQGISPIPFVGATLTCANMFLNMLEALWFRVIFPIAGAVAVAEFTALLASNAGPQGFFCCNPHLPWNQGSESVDQLELY